LYERLGVPAYWIVDPEGPSVVALRLVGGVYETEADVSGSDVFSADWPFPTQVVADELGR
jgi:Uma2 family endonuclease